MKIIYCIVFSFFLIQAYSQSTFELVYDIFQDKCADCHNPDDLRGNFDLEGVGNSKAQRMEAIYTSIVQGEPINDYANAQGWNTIYPGRADMSYLFLKINGDLEPTLGLSEEAGDPMPARAGIELTNTEKETIRQWILFGAPQEKAVANVELIDAYYTEGGTESFPEGPPPAPKAGEGFQIKFGPFFIDPVGEEEYFWKYDTHLPEELEINRIDMDISVYSHHFIMYNFTEGGDQQVEAGLRNYQNHNDIGIVAGVQQSEDLQLPNNTAFKWQEEIVLDLNSHVINYTTDRLKAEAYINIYTQAAGTAAQEMRALLIPNPDIFIPNDGEEVTYEQRIQVPFGDMFIWGMLGHTHKYGTSYKAWTLDDAGGKDVLLYDASCPEGIPGCAAPFYDYQHLPTRFFEPLQFVSLQKGIIHEAKWVNNGLSNVAWGPTSDDEMMILGLFFTLDTAGVSTSIMPLQTAPALNVSPNPFNHEVRMEFPNSGLLTVYNASGKEVIRKQVNAGIEIIQSGLESPGMYFYQFQSHTQQNYAGKIIKN